MEAIAAAAVAVPLVVSNPALYASAIVINESISSFYSCNFVQDLIRDASDGRRLTVHLFALSDIQ